MYPIIKLVPNIEYVIIIMTEIIVDKNEILNL